MYENDGSALAPGGVGAIGEEDDLPLLAHAADAFVGKVC